MGLFESVQNIGVGANTAASSRALFGDPYLDPFARHNRALAVLEERSIQVVQSYCDAGRDYFIEAQIPAGNYRLEVALSPFDPKDDKFLYMNNPPDRQHLPVEIDFASSVFTRLRREFLSTLSSLGELSIRSFVDALDTTIQSNIRSAHVTDDIHRASDLLTAGESACAGKSLVAAIVAVTTHLTSLDPIRVHILQGDTNNYLTKAARDFGHAWLRISSGKDVVLYDPYFRKRCFLSESNTGSFRQSSFSSYGIEASFLASFNRYSPININSLKGACLFKTSSGAHALRASDDQLFSAQFHGTIVAKLETKGGSIILRNGGFSRSRDPNSRVAARAIDPLIDLEALAR